MEDGDHAVGTGQLAVAFEEVYGGSVYATEAPILQYEIPFSFHRSGVLGSGNPFSERVSGVWGGIRAGADADVSFHRIGMDEDAGTHPVGGRDASRHVDRDPYPEWLRCQVGGAILRQGRGGDHRATVARSAVPVAGIGDHGVSTHPLECLE